MNIDKGLETPDDGNYDYIEVMATSEDEAIEKAKDRLHDAEEGEAHNFEARVKE